MCYLFPKQIYKQCVTVYSTIADYRLVIKYAGMQDCVLTSCGCWSAGGHYLNVTWYHHLINWASTKASIVQHISSASIFKKGLSDYCVRLIVIMGRIISVIFQSISTIIVILINKSVWQKNVVHTSHLDRKLPFGPKHIPPPLVSSDCNIFFYAFPTRGANHTTH